MQPLSCNLGAQPLGCVVDFSLLSAPSPAAPWPRLGQVLGLCPKPPQPFGCLGGFVLIPASLWLRKGHFWGFVPKPHGEASLQPLGDTGDVSLLLVLSPAAPQHHQAPVRGCVLDPNTPWGLIPVLTSPLPILGPQEPPSQLRAEGQEPRRVPVPQLPASSCPWGWDFGTRRLFTRRRPGQGQVL